MSTARIQLRGDLSTNWSAVNPILAEREFAVETDTLKYKIGNGILDWNSLPYSSVEVDAGDNIDVTFATVSLKDDISVTSISATTIYSGGTNLIDLIPAQYDYDLIVAASDEVTALTTGTAKVTFYAPRNFTLTGATATLSTAGSTTTTVDLNYNGSTVFASPISLTNGVFYNTASTTTTSISQFGKFTVDIDAAGTGAKGLKVALMGYKTF